jgi:hypothetical protein
MDFKSLLSQLDQLNEATEKTKTGLKHTAEPGGYGRKDDEDEEGNKVKAEPTEKRGKGRPKKATQTSGEDKKYDFSAFGVKAGKDVKLPKYDKKKTTKHSLKEYFDQLDQALNEEGYSTAPMPGAVAVKDATGKVVATAKNPQAAAAFQKGDITLGGEEMKEGDVGKHNNATTGFDALVRKLTPKYGKEAATKIAGAQMKKIKEAEMPTHDGDMGAGLGAGRSQQFEAKKPDANKNGIPDYAEDGKGKNDLKKKKVKEDMDSESKTDKSKLPSMAHIKKMCKDGKSVAEICKMHPDCDQKELKQMIADCKKKMVKEGMNENLLIAKLKGKHDGMKGHSHCGKTYEDMEEARMYHEGYKEGLDECYGQMPIRGLVGEMGNEVENMASYGARTPAMEDDMYEVDKTTYMKQQAMKDPGDTFNAFGQTMRDSDVLDEFAFEALDNQLNALLESKEEVAEGMTVSISKGQQGAPDSVSVSAQDGEADQLLSIIKSAGLGLFGGEETNGYGAPQGSTQAPGGIEVVDDHDGMMALMKKLAGGGEEVSGGDYESEEGHGDEHGREETCESCGGMMEADHSCGSKEMVDEVESEDQQLYNVAEDNPPDSGADNTNADVAGQVGSDAALAKADAGQDEEEGKIYSSPTNETEELTPAEKDDFDKKHPANVPFPGYKGKVKEAEDETGEEAGKEEMKERMSESSFFNLYKKLAMLSEESTSEKDDKAEKAAKKVAKDIEYDEDHKGKDDDKAEEAGKKVKKDIEYDDKKDKKEKIDEWANDAGPGKSVSDTTFEADIDFMMNIISGGLNKRKQTGQTTIPVVSTQLNRMVSQGTTDINESKMLNESVSDWKKLAGI